jgi:hypothetical protein
MLHIVNAIFAEPAILAEVYGERAIADDSVERSSETMDLEAIGSDHLPGEVAAGAEAADIAAALRGDLMAAAYQLNNRLIWLEGVQDVLDDIIRNGLTRFPTPFEIQRVATPSYDANSPRLATLGPSLAADVAQIYASFTEHKWTEAGV